MIRAASSPAFFAPSIATQATGTPGGICTAESRASRPPRLLPRIGTPITGRSVWAAATPGQGRRHPGAGDDHLQPPHPGVRAVLADHLRVAVGAHHPDLVADARVVQRRPGRLHLGLVVLRAHDDPDQRLVDVDLLERLLDRGHRRPWSAASLARCSSGPLRSRSLCPLSVYAGHALDGAGGDVGADLHSVEGDPARPHRMRDRGPRRASRPRPVTLRTRPPAVTISPSRSAVPAWVTSAQLAPASSRPADHVALRGGRRVAGGGEDEGHRPVVGELRLGARQAARLARGQQRSSRSERSRGSTAWVSGSPKRALNSSTFGPPRPDHQAGVEDAVEGMAAARHRRRRPGGGRRRRSPRPRPGRSRAPASSCPCRRCSAPRRRRRSACSPGRGRAAPRSRRRRGRAARAPRPRGTPRARPSRLAEAPLGEEDVDRLARLGLRRADDHALARREPVGLEHGRDRRRGRAASRASSRLRSSTCARRSARRPPPSAPWRTPSSPRARPPPRSARRRGCRPRPARRRRRRPAAPRARRRPGRRRARRAAATIASTSSAPTSGRHSASAAIPALPGAQSSSGAWAERASARTIACSRPPPPTTRTFTAAPARRAQSEPAKSSAGIARQRLAASSSRASRARPRPWPSSSRRALRRS